VSVNLYLLANPVVAGGNGYMWLKVLSKKKYKSILKPLIGRADFKARKKIKKTGELSMAAEKKQNAMAESICTGKHLNFLFLPDQNHLLKNKTTIFLSRITSRTYRLSVCTA
jgi:hypothetical protein